jgi:transcriptional regulator with XRE-family HTH domain
MTHATTQAAPPNRIRELREAKGWSPEKLAVEAGVSYFTIVRLESGAVRRPQRSTLAVIAAALGVEPEELFEAAA